MQAGIPVVLRARTPLYQIAGSGFLAKTGYPDRKVIDNSGRALPVKRDERPGGPEANNSKRLILADDREAKKFLIESTRAPNVLRVVHHEIERPDRNCGPTR